MTPEQEQAELEHCERIAEILWTKARSQFEMSECLLQERAAAREQGRAEGSADADRQASRFWRGLCDRELAIRDELHSDEYDKLESRHERLVAAARAYKDTIRSGYVRGVTSVAEERLAAALENELPTVDWRAKYETAMRDVRRLRAERDHDDGWLRAEVSVDLIDPSEYPEPVDADEHMRIEQLLKERGA